jgi:RNA polymerase sigma-70 factor (ECF subfamily)
MDLIENDIIQRIKDGEQNSIVLLFRMYYAPLYSYAAGILKNKESAEEVVQDTFIKIWESRSHIEITSSLRGYLYRCVHNKCLNSIRENKNSKNLFIPIDKLNPLAGLKTDTAPEILESIFSAEMEKFLGEAVETLPEQCRQIFNLCRFEELSYPEISVRLGISLSTVKTQMQRAMVKLSEAVKDLLLL